MFIQNLNNGVSILTQQVSGLQGFTSTMLNVSDDDGADSMMGTIPGPAGQTGARGSQGMPGMDGQDGEDGHSFPPPQPGPNGVASFGPAAVASITVANGIITAIS